MELHLLWVYLGFCFSFLLQVFFCFCLINQNFFCNVFQHFLRLLDCLKSHRINDNDNEPMKWYNKADRGIIDDSIGVTLNWVAGSANGHV